MCVQNIENVILLQTSLIQLSSPLISSEGFSHWLEGTEEIRTGIISSPHLIAEPYDT